MNGRNMMVRETDSLSEARIFFRKKRCWGLLCLLFGSLALSAQNFVWKAGVHSFFDNEEYAGSAVQTPQTMAGVHLVPQVGVAWNGKHRVFAGVDALKEFGTDRVLDAASLLAYYEYEGRYFDFRMGVFPRQEVLDRYPRMFFQDSIAYYRPVMTGLSWEYHRKHGYAHVWLDWTGRQTTEKRETFFIGWSGRYNLGVFYGQHFGYMYHFAKRKNPPQPDPLHDNGLIWTSLGVDLASKTSFEKLELNVGWSAGAERNRDGDNAWHVAHGLLSELKVEYKGLGLFNTYYRGGAQQRFYAQYGNALYWGDSFYRTKEYNRTDLYVNFFKTPVVNVKLVVSFHWAERNLYNEQTLCASFDLDNLQKKKAPRYEYIWDGWFKPASSRSEGGL